jgi:four helix bundle protein
VSRFDHENLDVYQFALEFVVTANEAVSHLPTGRGYLGDQLNRAALSIVLNIAEGAGEFSKPEKARFYRMAKRSATECAAVLDACRVLGLVPDKPLAVGREQLLRVSAMLTRLIQGLIGGREAETGNGTGRGTGMGRGKGMGRTGG